MSHFQYRTFGLSVTSPDGLGSSRVSRRFASVRLFEQHHGESRDVENTRYAAHLRETDCREIESASDEKRIVSAQVHGYPGKNLRYPGVTSLFQFSLDRT